MRCEWRILFSTLKKGETKVAPIEEERAEGNFRRNRIKLHIKTSKKEIKEQEFVWPS